MDEEEKDVEVPVADELLDGLGEDVPLLEDEEDDPLEEDDLEEEAF